MRADGTARSGSPAASSAGAGGLPDTPEERTSALVARLAERLEVPAEAVVVGWLLRLPHGIRPVVGTLNPRRIAACAQAPRAAQLMTHEDWYALWTAARGRPLP